MATPTKSKKQIEREAQEERAKHLAYIGTLATGLAHEIRSPLSAIKLNLDLLKEDLAAVDAAQRESFAARLSIITREVDGLQELLTEFLAFARPPRLEPLPVDVNALLQEMVNFLGPSLQERRISVEIDFQKELYPLALDSHQFARGVILNLLTNAMEQIGANGAIVLRTREFPDHVDISIEDTGGGVKPDHEARIFELFFSTKEHGTGLGLPIARRIVQEHGGDLLLINRAPRGATFIIRLPKSKILEFNTPGAPGSPGARPPAK